MNVYPQHVAARSWLNEQINGASRVGLPWHRLLAFLRVSTNPRVYATPATVSEACLQLEEWLSLTTIWTPEPGSRHAEILLNLLRIVGARGKLTSDANIAALAIEHGLTICSADTDFARFPNVRWMNPLAT